MSKEIGMSVKMAENDKKRWECFCSEFNGTNKELMGVFLDLYEANKIRNSNVPVSRNLTLLLDKIEQVRRVAINIHNISKTESEDSKEKLAKLQVENQDIVEDLNSKIRDAKKSIKSLSQENESLVEIKTTRDQVFKTCENLQLLMDDYKEKVRILENMNDDYKNEITQAHKLVETFKEKNQEKNNEILILKNVIETAHAEINSLKDNMESFRNSMQEMIFEKDNRIDDLKEILERYQGTSDLNKRENEKQE